MDSLQSISSDALKASFQSALIATLLACALWAWIPHPSCAQPQDRAELVAALDSAATPLTPGQTVSDTLATGESHTYTVELDAGQFAYGNVKQRTVDVMVNVYAPDGTALETHDVLWRWPEPFHFRSDTAGVHRIEVTPYKENQGRYAISLKRIEPVATAPEARVDQLMAAYDGDDVPGGIVGVIRDGEVAFATAYGMADLAHDIPITTETRFNLGSASKQFLGFAFALLAEQGELSLDDPVQNYLPDWPTFEQTVILRHLLTHTSGYREAYGTQHVAGRIPGEDFLPREAALEAVRRQPTLEFPAGSEFQYNSLAYVILAEVLEEVTGTPAATWVEENVFGPLGMEQSAIESQVGEVIPNAAHSYDETEDGEAIREFSNRAIFGAAEVYTTVGDLANWFQNFQTAELGGRAVQERLREPFVLTTGDTTKYALGLTVDEHRGLRRIKHGGAHAGFRSRLVYYPELDAGVVVMRNGPGMHEVILSNRVAEIAFGDHMEPKPIDLLADQDRAPLDSTQLARYAGKYRAEDGGVYTIEQKGDTLSVDGQYDLVPRSDSVFYVKGWLYHRAVFHPNDDGGVQRATLYSLHEPNHLRRMEPWTPTVDELEAFAGTYHSSEVQTRYTISLADSQLVAKHPRHGTMPLKPVEKDAFQMANSVQIQFERTDTGLITGYYASIVRTRDIWFQQIE